MRDPRRAALMAMLLLGAAGFAGPADAAGKRKAAAPSRELIELDLSDDATQRPPAGPLKPRPSEPIILDLSAGRRNPLKTEPIIPGDDVTTSGEDATGDCDIERDFIFMGGDQKDKIAACTKHIAAGKTKGKNLAYLYYTRGHYYLRQESAQAIQSAISDFNRAIAIAPAADKYEALGHALKAKNDFDGALNAYRKANGLTAGYADNDLINLFRARAAQRQDKGGAGAGIADLTAAIKVGLPVDVRATLLRDRAEMKNQAGDRDGAIADLTEAIQSNPSLSRVSALHIERATLVKQKSGLDAGIADLTSGIDRLSTASQSPSSGLIYLFKMRAAFWSEKGDLGQAIADLTAAARTKSDDSAKIQLYKDRSALARKQDGIDAALADLAAAIGDKPADRVQLALYREHIALLREKKDLSGVAADLTAATKLKLSDADRLALTKEHLALLKANGDLDGTAAMLGEIAKLKLPDGERAAIQRERVALFKAKGDLEGANAALIEAAGLDAKAAPQLDLIKERIALWQDKDRDRAMAELMREVRKPENASIIVALHRLRAELWKSSNVGAAIGSLNEAIAVATSQPSRRQISRPVTPTARPPGGPAAAPALPDISTLVQQSASTRSSRSSAPAAAPPELPELAALFRDRAELKRSQGFIDDAVSDYGEAISAAADSPLTAGLYKERIALLKQKGDVDGASADLVEAIKRAARDRSSDLVDLIIEFAEFRSAKGDPDAAINALTEALKQDSSASRARLLRAKLFQAKGQLDKARDDLWGIQAVPAQTAAERALRDEATKVLDELRQSPGSAALASVPTPKVITSNPPTPPAPVVAAVAPPSVEPKAATPSAAPIPPVAVAPKATPQVATVQTPAPAKPSLAVVPGRRFALVIGNDRYDNLPLLQKAVNDARAVADRLSRLGFDVIRLENATRREINEKLAELYAKVGRGDTAFFFFAGHGISIKDTNYLLATDTPPAREGQERLITGEAIGADAVLDGLQERGARVSLLVLDACRDNPFKSGSNGRGIGASRGLGQMQAPEGVFVLYSAGIGQTALDRLSDRDTDANSVFTRTFIKLLDRRDLSLQELAKTTQGEVKKLAASVHHVQMPAYYDQVDGTLALAPN